LPVTIFKDDTLASIIECCGFYKHCARRKDYRGLDCFGSGGGRSFTVLGPVWSLIFAFVFFGGFFGLYWLKAHRQDRGWNQALAAKDKTINLLNDQNRELRVQALAIGQQFTKEEAVKLVYGGDRQLTQ
jgi:hypothetical protein